MIVVIILTVVFALMGIICALGKGGFLIAGYNTADAEDKAKYDAKRLNRCYAVFCFVLGAVTGVSGLVGTEKFAVWVGLPLILLSVVLLCIASGTYCKKKG